MVTPAIIGFAVSAGFVFYVLFGYPVLLAWLASRKSRPVLTMAFQAKMVSVLLPVRDGELWIRAKLQSILRLEYPRELIEVVVVSDGSADRTDDIVGEFAPFGVGCLRVARRGKAAAINAGLERCHGEIVLFTDVRQELAPDGLKLLVSCFADPSVGVASGELVIRDGKSHEESNVGLYWKYEKWIRRGMSRIDSVLGASGCIYAMRRHLVPILPPDTLLDDMYTPLAAFFRGYRIVMTNAKAYDEPTTLKTEFRRKVRTQAGVYQLIKEYPALLGPSNRMWIHFVSHKLGRLLLPWALIVMAVCSFFLPPPWAGLAVAPQALVYGIAALDGLIPESFPFKRLSSVLRTFVVLMAAAACAVSICFVRSEVFWSRPTGHINRR